MALKTNSPLGSASCHTPILSAEVFSFRLSGIGSGAMGPIFFPFATNSNSKFLLPSTSGPLSDTPSIRHQALNTVSTGFGFGGTGFGFGVSTIAATTFPSFGSGTSAFIGASGILLTGSLSTSGAIGSGRSPLGVSSTPATFFALPFLGFSPSSALSFCTTGASLASFILR